MIIYNPDYSTYDFTNLINSMRRYDDLLNLGQNPWLPLQVSKAMQWKVAGVLFLAEKNPVAWFSAVFTGREFFSIPHFNNGSFWCDKVTLRQWLNNHSVNMHVNESIFFNRFINREQWFRFDIDNNQLTVISLEAKDFCSSVITANPLAILRYRCYLPLSAFHFNHKTDSVLKLEPTVEGQWRSFRRKIRYKIGKAERSGFVIRNDGIDLLNDFYEVYRKNIHHLGSMGLPIQFFQKLCENSFNGNMRIFVAYFNEKPVGSAILMSWLHFAENPWFASINAYNHFYLTYLLHWEMMKQAILSQCGRYSFGHSTIGSSVHYYKRQWGATDRTIFLNSSKKQSDNSGKIKYLRNVIRHLPLSLVKQLDKFIAKRFY